MNPELDRLKNDLATVHQALALPPADARDWLPWLRRDKWFNLCWCLPGFILIAHAFIPIDPTQKFLGLVAAQWTGILIAISLLGIAAMSTRRVFRRDGRPESLIRETHRTAGLTRQGVGFNVAFLLQIVFYFIWSRHYHLGFEAFWDGFFILTGSTCLLAALTARAWIMLGFALPFLAYGLCLPLIAGHSQLKALLFGLMFIAIGLTFAFIQNCQIRNLARE